MAREIDPAQTPRAAAAVWMQAPMPMLTLFQTLDVTPLLRLSRRHKLKFHMLLCWCIGRAAARTPEFALLPVGGKLMQYDKLAINTVVALEGGGINTCDIPVSDSLIRFNRDYLALTGRVRRTGRAHELGEDYMVIGTSALPGHKIDGAVNIALDGIRGHLDELDKSKPVYVNCFSGMRSYIACRILRGNGFDCYNLSGGWRLYDLTQRGKADNEHYPCGERK